MQLILAETQVYWLNKDACDSEHEIELSTV
jgi:hypothetical protein